MADYIKREAFLEQKREQYCKDCARRKGMRNGKYKTLYEIGEAPCRACETNDVLNDVEDFPAADVAPVQHGRWIKSPECPEQYDICSVCGLNDKHRSRGDADHPALKSIPPFCKWCGAKMDGGDE